MFDKKKIFLLTQQHKVVLIILIVGILLMIVSGIVENRNDKKAISKDNTNNNFVVENVNNSAYAVADNIMSSFSYVELEEKRLAEFLKSIRGVGDVEVIIYVDTSSKFVNASDSNIKNSQLNETDTNGGSRENITNDENITYKVVKDNNGNEHLIPLYTEYPEIIGIAVSAEGADSSIVKENILNAIKAIYDIPLHKVEVLAKK